MPRKAMGVRTWIMRIHRWMGVVFCWLFLVWFVSGFVMIYCRFPHVEAADRLAREESLDSGRMRISPAWAWASLHESTAPTRIRLNVLDGRPVYRIQFGRRSSL